MSTEAGARKTFQSRDSSRAKSQSQPDPVTAQISQIQTPQYEAGDRGVPSVLMSS